MNVSQEVVQDILLVRIAGRLDSTNSLELEHLMTTALEEGTKSIVLDFALLEYISSAGLRVVLLVGKRLNERKGRFALSGLRQNVNEVFRISGFQALFSVYPAAADAIKALSRK